MSGPDATPQPEPLLPDCRTDPDYIQAEKAFRHLWSSATGHPGQYGRFAIEGVVHNSEVTEATPLSAIKIRFDKGKKKPTK